jgi:hypothetical protein
MSTSCAVSCGRLVEDDDLGRGRHRPCDCDQRPLAGRQGADLLSGSMSQPIERSASRACASSAFHAISPPRRDSHVTRPKFSATVIVSTRPKSWWMKLNGSFAVRGRTVSPRKITRPDRHPRHLPAPG